MKLNQENTEVVSNLLSQKTSFGISESLADQSLAISVITDKGYRDKLTCVQEYICNARDAHREIGQTRPIEITAPTVFDATFKVRDFGPGLSPEQMVNVFVKFFASTKRRDNNQTGGFGLGAKSGWAYSDSFGVVSIERGMKRSYTAYKAGQGILQPDFEEKTTEPSGIEISIPVKPSDVKAFEKAIRKAVYFWNESERPVLTNMTMEYPASPKMFGQMAFYDMTHFSAMLGNSYYHHDRKDYVILDGVLYNLDQNEYSNIGLDHLNHYKREVKSFFLVCKTGEVAVTPFRESLEFNDFTVKALKGFINQSLEAIKLSFETEMKVKEVSKKVETIKRFSNVTEIETVKLSDNLSYQNGHLRVVPDNREDFSHMGMFHHTKSSNRFKGVVSHVTHMINLDPKATYYQYDAKKDPDTETMARKKVAQLSEKVSEQVFFLVFKPGSEAIETAFKSGVEVKSTKDLTFEKVARKPQSVRTVKTGIDCQDLADYKVTTYEKTEKLKKITFITASQYVSDKYGFRTTAEYLKKEGFTLISIGKSDEKAILAMGGIPFETFMATFEIKQSTMLGVMSEYDLKGGRYESKMIIELDGMFKNKAVSNYISLLKKVVSKKEDTDYRHLQAIHRVLQNNPKYMELLQIQEEGYKIMEEKFPLILQVNNIKEMKSELKVYIEAKEKGVK